ncbi:MAG TPA: MBL fold metallo-hydrolase [Burkholderiales bacterium]|nr:MBL fold metallo-hydrolase [Burkholderiales bacterium]
MNVQPFFDPHTATISYVVADPATRACAIIDPVLDYDPARGRTSTHSADRVIAHVRAHDYQVAWILDTHVHADHLTAAAYLKQILGGMTGIGAKVTTVLRHWVPIFNTVHDTPLDGSQFDRLFADGEIFRIGALAATVIETPGHTPACISYHIGDAVFVGDTLFMPDYGTARTDFPGGNAHAMYRSIRRLLALPDSTRVFTCHDYPPEGRGPAWESTVAEQREKNILINDQVAESDYVAERSQRDRGKPAPQLLLPSLQVNLRAGEFGTPEDNGVRYIRIPINAL